MSGIHYYSEGIAFKLPKPGNTKRWIRKVIAAEKKHLGHLNFIFCSDRYLLKLNQEYLNHNTLTDIITFDHSETDAVLEGDIFVSVERVKANATELETGFDQELHRVLIHGVLHLIGFGDKSPRQKSLMRKKEDAYLSLRQ